MVLVGVLAGCGDGIALPDATVLEDVPRERVTVEVRSARVGSGARLTFQDRDSQVIAATKTDGDGRGNAYVPSTIEFVTIELEDRSDIPTRWMYTIQDVSPGDHVVLDDGTLSSSIAFIATLPREPREFPALTLHTPCGVFFEIQPEVATDITLTSCGPVADMLVTSDQNTFVYRPDVAIVDGGSVSITGEYQPFVARHLRVTELPPSTFQVRVSQTLLDGSRALYSPFETFASVDPNQRTADATLFTPDWPEARVLTRVLESNSNIGTRAMYTWGPRTEPHEIDVSPDRVRSLLTFPTFQPETNVVSWLETDQGRVPDAALLSLQWTVDDRGTFTNVEWRYFTPRTETTRIELPRLPDSTNQPLSPFIDLTNFAIEGGYERLRKLPFLTRWQSNSVGNTWLVDTAEGRLTFQTLATF